MECGRPGVQSLGRKDPLEKEMATHSSTLAWRIPWREEPDRLQSVGSHLLYTRYQFIMILGGEGRLFISMGVDGLVT